MQFFSTEPDLDPGPTPVEDLEIVRNAYSIDESYLICTYFAKNNFKFGYFRKRSSIAGADTVYLS
jgi:hypothetical protein